MQTRMHLVLGLTLIACGGDDGGSPASAANTNTSKTNTNSATASNAGKFDVELTVDNVHDAHDLPEYPDYLQSGDFDGDGAQDFVVGLGSSSTAGVYRILHLSSQGGFDAPDVRLECPKGHCSSANSLFIDVNGDQKTDIVDVFGVDKINAPPESYIRAYLGDGAGSFGAPVVTTIPYESAWMSAKVEDPNQHDVYFVADRTKECAETLRATLAAGNTCSRDTDCQAGEECIAVVDGMNHCAAPCDRVLAFHSDASGSFSELWNVDPKISLATTATQIVDYDDDGQLDILAVSASSAVKPQFYKGHGKTFDPGVMLTGAFPNSLVDADGDGELDVNDFGAITFREHGGAFGPKVATTEADHSAIRTLSFMHGGERLFAQQNSKSSDESELVIYRAKGRTVEYLHRLKLDDDSIEGLTAGDFDNDGLLEFIWIKNAERGLRHFEFTK